MSHFSQIKTQIRNLDSLKAALTDAGVDWKSGPTEVRGYRGQTCVADIAIQQDNGYDIGFSWNGNEYELVADLQYWQQPLTVQGFLNQVSQRYAFHTVKNEASNQGFHVAEQKADENGAIRLVLQRWSA
ncbi:MAG: DUF1257 domain-containing protein [Synechococcales bacterium]|nr:DUF1257 domain-containing protein [Synechococcales bacterium]